MHIGRNVTGILIIIYKNITFTYKVCIEILNIIYEYKTIILYKNLTLYYRYKYTLYMTGCN